MAKNTDINDIYFSLEKIYLENFETIGEFQYGKY